MRKRRTSRLVAALCSCVAVAGFGATAQATHSADKKDPPQGNLPTVDMEQIVLVGQLDQYRNAGGHTAGAKADVKRVQKALRSKGYDISVDGNYGLQTMRAYSKWQKRSTGASGIGANGLAGVTSLKKLGAGRFQPIHLFGPGKHPVDYAGSPVNQRTKRMMKAASKRLGTGCALDVTKGSYQPGGDNSAFTHAGGGAVDVSVRTLCGHTIRQVVNAMKKVGFAAWHRTTRDFPTEHIHAIAINDPDMTTPVSNPGEFTASTQVAAFAAKASGLSSTFGPPNKRRLHTWEDYKRAHP